MANIMYKTDFLTGHVNKALLKEVEKIIGDHIQCVKEPTTRCTQFYIGKTSGNGDTKEVLKTRINDPKHAMYSSANRMICLYRTESLGYCDELETEMIEKYKHDRRCKNSGSGGEGRIKEDAKYHYVYLALKIMG